MNDTFGDRGTLSRRTLLKNIALVAFTEAGSSVFSTAFAQATPGARGAPAAAQTGGTSTKTTLILLGTQGGPGVSLTRSQAASVLIAGGQPYLVDCGYGTVRALVEAGIRMNDVRNIFLTHLHNDHTADVAALLSLKWTGGQTSPPPAAVYGPYGSKAMVDAAIAFFKADAEIRMVDEGRTVRPETIYAGHDLAAPKVTEVFRDERVKVSAVENAHFPDRAKEKMPYRSFAYRFDMPDRSIAFSGDTAYSTDLIELARGADILVCEVRGAGQQQADGRGAATNTESIARHVIETHSSAEDVGRMAAAAKVKTVVLSHMVGGGQRGTADPYTADIKKSFDGEIIVGSDQLHI
jgi:ribonuclease BN (tRNA processing enzyme)